MHVIAFRYEGFSWTGGSDSVMELMCLAKENKGLFTKANSEGELVDALQKTLEPPPLRLIRQGVLLRRNMRHELISEDELKSKLREHGVTDAAQVREAYMEPDGQITVIKR